jgi:cyclic-di-GMP-binding protein
VPFLEAYRAHGEILAALESFNNSVEVPGGERLQMLMRLDESSRGLQECLCQEYFHHPVALNQLESTLWNRIFSLYWQFMRGYRALIREHNANPGSRQAKFNLALITARALHYSGASFKWGYIRHVPVDPKTWQSLHNLYRTSERGSFTSHRIRLYENTEHTSCSEEYLRILLLDLLSPLSLSPAQIEIADQWLRRRVKSVRLDDAYAANKHWFYVDLAEAAGPRKVGSGVTGKKLRFLAMDELLGRIDDIIAGSGDLASLSRLDVVEDWQQVMNLELASQARAQWSAMSAMRPHPREATQQTQRLFQLLHARWSDDGYKRRHSREKVRQIVEVACDLPAICASLLSEEAKGPPGGNPDAPVSEEAVNLPKHWAVQNRSEGGYGLCARAEAQGRIRVNGLVGLKDGSQVGGWEIGAIRRISYESPEEIAVGVETLSRVPKRVELRCTGKLGVAGRKDHPGLDGQETPMVEAVLLSDIADPNMPGSLILPIADYPSRIMDLRDGDHTYRIRLATVLERTENWFRVGLTR